MRWQRKLWKNAMWRLEVSFIESALKLAGKEDFKIDKKISKGYMLRICLKYSLRLIRGKLFSLGYPKIRSSILVGSRVKTDEKRYLTIEAKAKLHDGVYIDALSREGVIIGERVILGRNCRVECTGTLSSIGKGVVIGNRTTFGNDCYFGAAGGINIGEDVVAGQYIRFHSENHNFGDVDKLIREQGVSHKGIRIGNNCWIGAGVVFLDGATLGDGCVVAANAVVTKSFPDNSVIGGIPAKLIKKRGEKE